MPRNAAPVIVAARGCAPPMPPMPPETISLPLRSPPKLPLARRHKRLIRPLDDSLRADINPRPGGHLPVGHQPRALQFVELFPVGPVPHKVGVAEQHARRIVMRAQDAHRLARLNQQRLVVLQRPSASARSRRSTPSCAPPFLCRHRPPDRADARPPLDQGCSSACAARPPAPSPCRRAPATSRFDRSVAAHRSFHFE